MTEERLLKKLWTAKDSLIDFPPETEQAKEILLLEISMWEVRIECARVRKAFLVEYAKTRKTIITRIQGDLLIEESKSLYNWEPIRDSLIPAINEKESKAIEYFTGKINQLRK